MNIKKRLIISNTITVIIPFAITAIVAFFFISFSSKLLHRDAGYNNFKKIANTRAELLNLAGSISSKDLESIEEIEFRKYLGQRLSSFNGKFIITKGDGLLLFSSEINKIDAEKCIEESEKMSLERVISINNIDYMLESGELVFKDGQSGRIILLAPIGKGAGLFKEFIILIFAVFLGSFIAANIIMSYLFSKRILRPLSHLKKAAAEISSGNLEIEIIEDGDEEIRELCHDFEAMRIQLKDSIHMKMKYDDNRKMLVSSISHDLKTPITSIKGYVEGILDGVANTPEKIESYLKTIYSKAQYIDGMIDDLLLYSKLDLKQLPFNFEKTDLIEYFSYCIYETESELLKSNIKINLKNDLKSSKFVMIDRERMRRVIMNIIDNSRKYMDKKHGEITISLRETNSSIIVEIRDNGRGIGEHDVNRIFDRFYRADSARSGAKGSGMGLSIARQIVEGHGGRIWAVSHGEEGTSIMISLEKIVEDRGFYEKDTNCRG